MTTQMWSLWSIAALVVALAIPIAVGFLGNAAGGRRVDGMYEIFISYCNTTCCNL